MKCVDDLLIEANSKQPLMDHIFTTLREAKAYNPVQINSPIQGLLQEVLIPYATQHDKKNTIYQDPACDKNIE